MQLCEDLASDGSLAMHVSFGLTEFEGAGVAELSLLHLQFGAEANLPVHPRNGIGMQPFLSFLALETPELRHIHDHQLHLISERHDPIGAVVAIADRWASATKWVDRTLQQLFDRDVFPSTARYLVATWTTLRERVGRDLAGRCVANALEREQAELLVLARDAGDQSLAESLLDAVSDIEVSPERTATIQTVVEIVESADADDWTHALNTGDGAPLSTVRVLVEIDEAPELALSCQDALESVLRQVVEGGLESPKADDIGLLVRLLTPANRTIFIQRAMDTLASANKAVASAFFDGFGSVLEGLEEFRSAGNDLIAVFTHLVSSNDPQGIRWAASVLAAADSPVSDSDAVERLRQAIRDLRASNPEPPDGLDDLEALL